MLADLATPVHEVVGDMVHDGFYQQLEGVSGSADSSGEAANQPAEDPVTRKRDTYVPKGMAQAHWLAIRPLVLEAVGPCNAKTPYEMNQLLTVTAKYFDFGVRVAGYTPTLVALLDRRKIVAYINHLLKTENLSRATLGTYRSRLLAIADANIGHIQPSSRMPGFRGADGSTPYSEQEEVELRAWLDALPRHWQVDFKLLYALSRGAGLTTGEVLAVTAGHVEVDDEGVVINVPGDRGRAVPVLAEHEGVVADLAVAAWKSDMFLFRPKRVVRESRVLSDMLHKAKNKPFPVSVQRLRATWIVTHLNAETPVQALLSASGIETLGALGRFYDYVPAVEAKRARAALTMRARAEGCRASVCGRPLSGVGEE